jgi:hypothetical protein
VKVLLDEMLPIGVRDFLPQHNVVTAAHAGLAGVSNGEMIRRAVEEGFEVIVSLDRGIPHQQNLDRYGIGFVLIRVDGRVGECDHPADPDAGRVRGQVARRHDHGEGRLPGTLH